MSQNPFDNYIESQVHSSSPLRLVTMLYQAAIDSLQTAREELSGGDVKKRAKATTRAANIVVELMQALDLERGGEVAASLLRLYDYLLYRIREANQAGDELAYTECIILLGTLLDGWKNISDVTQAFPSSIVRGTHDYQPIEFCA